MPTVANDKGPKKHVESADSILCKRGKATVFLTLANGNNVAKLKEQLVEALGDTSRSKPSVKDVVLATVDGTSYSELEDKEAVESAPGGKKLTLAWRLQDEEFTIDEPPQEDEEEDQ